MIFASLTPWILFGLAVIVAAGLVLIPHNWRVHRVRKAYRMLPQDVRRQVLDAVRDASLHGRYVTFLRLSERQTDDQREMATVSHVGGSPYAEAEDQWPMHDGEPARFLMQARLDNPSLGATWHGRLITVFMVFDLEQVVRSYGEPSIGRFKSLASPQPAVACVPLEHLPLLAISDDAFHPALPADLCRLIPEIPHLIKPYCSDAPGLLAQILRPNLYGYNLEEPDLAYIGGKPALIQNPHDPVCQHCGQAMRFLFQFGEIIPDHKMADGGVCYVYGCDQHPAHCRAFIDSH